MPDKRVPDERGRIEFTKEMRKTYKILFPNMAEIHFRILQNVGLSAREVNRVVSRQVLLMFYLPLAMAVVHIAVAFPALCKVLQGFQLYNTHLFLLCTAASAGVFLVFYLLTYRLTARTYCRIVRV